MDKFLVRSPVNARCSKLPVLMLSATDNQDLWGLKSFPSPSGSILSLYGMTCDTFWNNCVLVYKAGDAEWATSLERAPPVCVPVKVWFEAPSLNRWLTPRPQPSTKFLKSSFKAKIWKFFQDPNSSMNLIFKFIIQWVVSARFFHKIQSVARLVNTSLAAEAPWRGKTPFLVRQDKVHGTKVPEPRQSPCTETKSLNRDKVRVLLRTTPCTQPFC